MSKSFAGPRTSIHNVVRLNETFKHMDAPLGFKGTLAHHQKPLLAGMVDLESGNILLEDKSQIKTCFGKLSEKLGAGKTAIILALLLTNPIPKNLEIIFS